MDRGREIVAVNGVNSNGKSCPGAGEVNEGAGGVCGGGMSSSTGLFLWPVGINNNFSESQ